MLRGWEGVMRHPVVSANTITKARSPLAGLSIFCERVKVIPSPARGVSALAQPSDGIEEAKE
jgi:hypothetical protein